MKRFDTPGLLNLKILNFLAFMVSNFYSRLSSHPIALYRVCLATSTHQCRAQRCPYLFPATLVSISLLTTFFGSSAVVPKSLEVRKSPSMSDSMSDGFSQGRVYLIRSPPRNLRCLREHVHRQCSSFL